VLRTEEIAERVVIAVDPHKPSWTAAVVNASLQPVATLRVPVSAAGYQQLRRFADRWPQACRVPEVGRTRDLGERDDPRDQDDRALCRCACST
jgi:hypothetical protein